MKSKQITITGAELFDALPDGDLPDGLVVNVQGIDFTVDQIDKITKVLRQDLTLTIQRLRNRRLAVQTELMPVGIWTLFEPSGYFKTTAEKMI